MSNSLPITGGNFPHPPISVTSPSGTEKSVCEDIARRQALGVAKYGTTVSANPLSPKQWLQHQYEELLDAAVYQKRIIEELEKKTAVAPEKEQHVFEKFPVLSRFKLNNFTYTVVRHQKGHAGYPGCVTMWVVLPSISAVEEKLICQYIFAGTLHTREFKSHEFYLLS